MGNNACFQNGESSQFPRLLFQKQIGECQVLLTAGPVDKEDVECLVVPTDCQFSNLKHRPSFIPQNGQCIFSAATKRTKNQILTIVDESVVTSDKNLQEKQTIYEAVQGALNLADQRQMKSVGFPVLNSIDYATSATIMLLAIKFSLTEHRFNSLRKVVITLDVLLESFQHIEKCLIQRFGSREVAMKVPLHHNVKHKKYQQQEKVIENQKLPDQFYYII